MLTQSQKQRIEKLYIDYSDVVKPGIFYVERKYGKFPIGLLKEFRDVFDHISRCYNEDATEGYIDREITKAENHFERIKLDVLKYISDYKRREFVQWKRKYLKYDLQGIEDGDFWKGILKYEDEAERLFFKAKNIEATSINDSISLLEESSIQYESIFTEIEKKREKILKAKFKYNSVSVFKGVVGFISGVVASILATWIWSICFT